MSKLRAGAGGNSRQSERGVELVERTRQPGNFLHHERPGGLVRQHERELQRELAVPTNRK